MKKLRWFCTKCKKETDTPCGCPNEVLLDESGVTDDQYFMKDVLNEGVEEEKMGFNLFVLERHDTKEMWRFVSLYNDCKGPWRRDKALAMDEGYAHTEIIRFIFKF